MSGKPKKKVVKKISLATQLKKDKASRAKAVKKRHDIMMRASGRKELATNYGKFKDENKPKKARVRKYKS